MGFDLFITEKEKQLLEALQKAETLSAACEAIGIKKSTGSMRLRSVRDRYRRASEFCKDYEAFRSKLPSRYL